MVSLEICKDGQIGVGGRGVEGGRRDRGGEAVEECGGWGEAHDGDDLSS